MGLKLKLLAAILASALSVPAVAKLTQVTTGTFTFNAKAAATSFGCKSIHVAKEAYSPSNPIHAVHANWFAAGGAAETGTGSTATLKCTIEYPLGGTKTQFLYSGSVTGSVPSLTEIESDGLPLTIPEGAEFAIYSSWANTGGCAYFNYWATDGRCQGMASPTPDLTVPGSTGDWTASPLIGATYAGPVAIVAMSTRKAVLIAGDSISVGRGDSNTKIQGFTGRAFAPVCAYGHVGSSGDKLSVFKTSHARRVGLGRYYTHAFLNFGINDTTATGSVAATVHSDTETVVKYFTDLGLKVALTTLGPVSTDTAGNWQSVATQTTQANNSVRAAINNLRKAGTAGVSVLYDINPNIENVLNPEDGLWKNNSGAALTDDGTHENAAGYIAAAALINPQLLLNA